MWLEWLLRSECAMPHQHYMTAESAVVSSTIFTFGYQILLQIFQHPTSSNHVQRHPQSGQHALASQEAILGHPDFLHEIDFIKLLATTNLFVSQQVQHSTYSPHCQNIMQFQMQKANLFQIIWMPTIPVSGP